MTFKPGDPRPPGAGRQPGQKNRDTIRRGAGLREAIEICRSRPGEDPISIMMECSRFLRNVAAVFSPKGETPEALRAAFLATPKRDLDFIRRFMVDSSAIAYKAAEFAYSKMQRVDMTLAGDPENPVVVESNEAERFTRSIASLAARNGARSEDGGPLN